MPQAIAGIAVAVKELAGKRLGKSVSIETIGKKGGIAGQIISKERTGIFAAPGAWFDPEYRFPTMPNFAALWARTPTALSRT